MLHFSKDQVGLRAELRQAVGCICVRVLETGTLMIAQDPNQHPPAAISAQHPIEIVTIELTASEAGSFGG